MQRDIEPRPGRRATIKIERIEQVIIDHRRDLSKGMRRIGRGRTRPRNPVPRIPRSTRGWKAFGLNPHLEEGVQAFHDPFFTGKIYDIVGLYLRPLESAVVFCVDEKSKVQALQRSQPTLPGTPKLRDHVYVQYGTTSLFAALNVTDGAVLSSSQHQHR